MGLSVPVTLNDASGTSPTGDHVYSSFSSGTGERVLHVATAAFNAPETLRFSTEDRNVSGKRVKRTLVELRAGKEDTGDGKIHFMRTYLVIEIPVEVFLKADAVKQMEQMRDLLHMSTHANLSHIVNFDIG